MESFGLWYKLNNDAKDRAAGSQDDHPVFDLHANFWSEDIKVKDKNGVRVPYLDIGIKIKNWGSVECITFHCPFVLESGDIKDLAPELKEQATDELIFNDTCLPEPSGDYTTVTVKADQDNHEKLLLYPLSLRDGDKGLKANVELSPSFGYDQEKETDLKIDFDNFHRLLLNNGSKIRPDVDPRDDSIYIRFRIASNELENKIYFDSTPANKTIESAFTKTRIIDFKLNEERNLSQYVKHTIDEERSHLAEFGAVHFLVMVPSHFDVQFLPDKGLSCRELEKGQWDPYYGKQIDTDKDHVLAYHCKKKQDDNEDRVGAFTSLIRIKSYETDNWMIIDYMIIVVALGMISSAIVNFIQCIASGSGRFALYGCGTSLLIGFLVLLWASRRKKKKPE